MSEYAPRQLTSWIDSFSEYTSKLPSPELYRKWAGISCIAGALERKVWIETYGEQYFPNMYIVLAGSAGIGKSVLINRVQSFWATLEEHHIAPTSVTAASLVDSLDHAKRKLLRPMEFPSFIEFNSLLIPINELGVFLPEYSPEFMNTITDLWDGKRFSQHRRGKDLKIKIDNPCLNFIAGTTPSYLNSFIPEGAWEQGFMARVIMLYSGEVILTDPFGGGQTDTALREKLVADIRTISTYYGKLEYTPDAMEATRSWHMSGGEPSPNHPKLQNYRARRTSHLLKLSMIAAVDRGSHKLIEIQDFHQALDWLSEAEAHMADVFRAMNTGGDSRAMEEAWHYVYTEHMRKQKAVPQNQLVAFLSQRVPAHSVLRVLEIMTRGGMLKEHMPAGQVGMQYLPGTRG